MRKIISFAILAAFLFTNIAHSSNLRVPSNIDKKRTDKISDKLAYKKIAEWICRNSHIKYPKMTMAKIMKELKEGRVILNYQVSHDSDIEEFRTVFDRDFGDEEFTNAELKNSIYIDFRRGILSNQLSGSYLEWWGGEHGDSVPRETEKSIVQKIPEDILKLASEKLGIKVKPISEDGIKHLERETDDLVSWKASVWMKDILIIEEADIGRYLRSLAKNSPVKNRVKRVIVKKLIKLWDKRPKNIPIIRKKALELFEIDEVNFTSILFVDDARIIRGLMELNGISKNTAEFYNLFDKTVNSGITPKDCEWLTNELSHMEKRKIKYIKDSRKNLFILSLKNKFAGRYGERDFLIDVIPTIAKSAKDIGEFNRTCERISKLYLMLPDSKKAFYFADLVEIGIQTLNSLSELNKDFVDTAAVLAEELSNVTSFITKKHFKKAFDLQKQDGGFKVTASYTPAEVKREERYEPYESLGDWQAEVSAAAASSSSGRVGRGRYMRRKLDDVEIVIRKASARIKITPLKKSLRGKLEDSKKTRNKT
ncbi:MAG: hypothetical protein P9L93_05685 [Candidatus Gorgyraea atricola]|nr:hypothetical protein [Candidatus Gorgyraea atricola]